MATVEKLIKELTDKSDDSANTFSEVILDKVTIKLTEMKKKLAKEMLVPKKD